MITTPRIPAPFFYLAQLGSLALLLLSCASLGRAQLLIERHESGPHQYNGYWADNDVFAMVTFSEAVRITGINGWINGPDGGTATVNLFDSAFHGPLASASFSLDLVSGYPAKWQGAGPLHWDLPAGTYMVGFTDCFLPLSYGYFGPVSSAPGTDGFVLRSDAPDFSSIDPFGIRIYGAPLSAVPEPATFSLAGGFALLLLAVGRQRSRASQAPAPPAMDIT